MSNAKQLWSLAGPLIFGQVAVVGMTVTDIYMAGQISADELAAVQLGGSIWAVINLIVIGIMLGNSPIIGNHWGAGNKHLVRFQFQQALWLAVPVGMAVNCGILLGIYILGQLQIPPEVYDVGRRYMLPFLITGLMFPAFFVFRTTFEGMGDIRPVMVFNGLAFLLNIVLDYVLVFGKFGVPAMGGAGAGWATAIVMTFLLICMAIYAQRSSTMRALKLYSEFAQVNIAAIVSILTPRHSHRPEYRRRNYVFRHHPPDDRPPGFRRCRRSCYRHQYRFPGFYDSSGCSFSINHQSGYGGRRGRCQAGATLLYSRLQAGIDTGSQHRGLKNHPQGRL